jgi:hypothetical protein
METDYTVHDMVQSDQPSFGKNGTFSTVRVVTFYVGPHGPFRLEIPKEQATGDYIANQIQNQVRELRVANAVTGS